MKTKLVVGKHPVTTLYHYCQQRGIERPIFTEVRASKGFKFKVEVGGKVYESLRICRSKKEAKKDCAMNCLGSKGFLPLDYEDIRG